MSLGTARKTKICRTMDSTINLGLQRFLEMQPWAFVGEEPGEGGKEEPKDHCGWAPEMQ